MYESVTDFQSNPASSGFVNLNLKKIIFYFAEKHRRISGDAPASYYSSVCL
jgi:hypothetical protein